MDIWSVFSSSLCGAGIVSVGVYFSKSYIGSRIEQSIRHEYEKKLTIFRTDAEHTNQLAVEKLRADFTALQATHATAFNALTDGQRILHTRKLDAVAALWSELVDLRDKIPAVFSCLDFFVEGEYSTLVEREDYRELVAAAIQEHFVDCVNEVSLQNARLFGGESLYLVVFSYRQILGRILYQLEIGYERRTLDAWYLESGMQQILNATFSADEISTITMTEANTLNRARQLLELRFLNKANDVLSGRDAALETFDSISDILRVASELSPKSPKGNV